MTFYSLQRHGLLSFAPRSERFDLRPHNVLICANGPSKSNVIAALGLQAAMPPDLA